MTVYEVANPNAAPLYVVHEIQNSQATPVWAFGDTVAANASSQYHARDMTSLPAGFVGQVMLSAASPFTAEVVAFDYPDTATPTPTATRTATRTASPTRTATPTSTSTPTPYRITLPFRR
jgi:hypothetical protein